MSEQHIPQGDTTALYDPEVIALGAFGQLTAERQNDESEGQRGSWFSRPVRSRQPQPERKSIIYGSEAVAAAVAAIAAAEAIMNASHGTPITLHPDSDNPDMLANKEMTGRDSDLPTQTGE